MSTHGASQDLGNMDFSTLLYPAPISDTALDTIEANAASLNTGKEPTITAGTTGQYWRGDKTWQTLPSAGTGTVSSIGLSSSDLTVSGSPVTTAGNITANLSTTGVTAGTYSAVIVDTKGRVSAGTKRVINSAPGRSVVTGTGATGFQPSASRDTRVNYTISTSTTATIGGASTATVVLEIASTNSATPADWVEIARVSNGQTITLAVALQSVQTLSGNLGGLIPAGYYAKLRSITSGTASASYQSGQEVTE